MERYPHIYAVLSRYLCFLRPVHPEDVVVSRCLLGTGCTRASAALVERRANTWDWKPALSQLFNPPSR